MAIIGGSFDTLGTLWGDFGEMVKTENAQMLLNKVIEFGEVPKKELAASMGVSFKTMQRWTNPGDNTAYSISLSNFLDICDILGVGLTIRKTYSGGPDVSGTYTRSWKYNGESWEYGGGGG